MSNIATKIEHIWSVVCQMSLTDKDTNNISMINVVENLNVSIRTNEQIEKKKEEVGWYATPINVHVVNRFRKKADELEDMSFNFQMLVADPQGIYIGNPAEGTLAFPKDLRSMRTSVKLNGFPVTKSGTYHVVTKIKDVGENEYEEVGRVPIDVNLTVGDGQPQ